jgi:hypothetical protein
MTLESLAIAYMKIDITISQCGQHMDHERMVEHNLSMSSYIPHKDKQISPAESPSKECSTSVLIEAATSHSSSNCQQAEQSFSLREAHEIPYINLFNQLPKSNTQ